MEILLFSRSFPFYKEIRGKHDLKAGNQLSGKKDRHPI